MGSKKHKKHKRERHEGEEQTEDARGSTPSIEIPGRILAFSTVRDSSLPSSSIFEISLFFVAQFIDRRLMRLSPIIADRSPRFDGINSR